MIEQSELHSLHINVIHVPLESQFSSFKFFKISHSVRRNFVRGGGGGGGGGGLVYRPLCIQMIEQSEVQSLHINVVHVPLKSQFS